MSQFLWVVFPYLCLTVFVVGHVWRYRYDKFGWTTRSSQLYENRLLRIGSPLFHFGILGVFLGHVMGLGVPEVWTEAVGISEGMYHFMAVSIGALAGFATVVGMAILIYRRRTTGPVFSATTRMDKVMYLVLATVIVLGLVNTVVANIFGHYDYREGVSIWFRGIFRFSLHPELMAAAPLGFQLHGLAAIALFALWPFTRLVHVFSAPLGYLTRPYIVYRSRDDVQLGIPHPPPGLGAGQQVADRPDGTVRRARTASLRFLLLGRDLGGPQVGPEDLVADPRRRHAALQQRRADVPHERQRAAGEHLHVFGQRDLGQVHEPLPGSVLSGSTVSYQE